MRLSPQNEDALAMMARVTRDMNLRDERCNTLRVLSELYPNDLEVISAYAASLIEIYQTQGSIVNRQEMNDGVELLKRCVALSEGKDERFHVMLGLTLSGAERFTEAAEVYKALWEYRKESGTNSELLTETDLIYRIGDNYYNAGKLQEAEEYFRRGNELNPNDPEFFIMLNKISLKKHGIR